MVGFFVDKQVIPSRAQVLVLETEEEKEQFRELIRRATNTWDTMPQWIRKIADTLEGNPTPQ